jgi:predicted nucleotidyltransferase
MLTTNQILAKIEQHQETIRQFGVQKLTLFGSYARGEAKKNSDIDFLVEFEPGRGLFDDYAGLLEFLQGLLGKEVDLVKPAMVREELKEYIFGGEQVEALV